MKILWTDGSAMPNPGPGGFAVIEVSTDGTARPVMMGAEEFSTNIRMEGRALIAAIEYAGEEVCEIYTDSEFWVNVVTKWAPEWKKNEWHRKQDRKVGANGETIGWKKTSIKNKDLVVKLYELYEKYPVKLCWVRGHVGTKYNELADKWANKARKKLQKQL